MSIEPKEIGEQFSVQFVWRIPDGDFLRSLFAVEVLARDSLSEKYVILLKEFTAARQESSEGTMRSLEELNKEYWVLVSELVGKRISLAYEADDGRPLWLRLETLTGEHNFFSRLNELPPALSKRPPNGEESDQFAG
jgi:hypothetical protein